VANPAARAAFRPSTYHSLTIAQRREKGIPNRIGTYPVDKSPLSMILPQVHLR
jgi:hypothetical protein